MRKFADESEMRARLLQLIRERAYREGDFTLVSGQKSTYYINGKHAVMQSECAWLIGEVLFLHLERLGIAYDAVGGLSLGSIPISQSLVVSCFTHDRDVEGFFVRNERKEHGTKSLLEGRLPEPARAVLVDDVITSGKSVLKAVDAVIEAGGSVECVLAVVDREQGAAETFAERGLRYEPVFTKTELTSGQSAI